MAPRHCLFIHNNFPGQFGPIANALIELGWKVSFLTQKKTASHPDIAVYIYREREFPDEKLTQPAWRAAHPSFTTASSGLEVMTTLSKRGVRPDVIMAHSGWGSGTFAKQVWPDSRFVAYCEWYYRPDAPDRVYIDRPLPTPLSRAAEKVRNVPILLERFQRMQSR